MYPSVAFDVEDELLDRTLEVRIDAFQLSDNPSREVQFDCAPGFVRVR
jgi:hypothetical protein